MKYLSRTRFTAVAASLIVAVTVSAQSPPQPPEGFHWEVNESFSDEFEGTQLNSSKWHDHNPKWKGRPPGKFVPASVSVEDGYLKIRSTKMQQPDGEYTIACGAVQSKANDALYGYYECRVKASQITTSTTFWLVSDNIQTPDGTLHLELDIQESIGGAQRFEKFKSHMSSNTHVSLRPPGKDAETKKVKAGGHVALKSGVADDFHTYGCWWIDANTMKFYADGQYAFTIEPSTELTAHPFSHPMKMNLVCETYSWETVPTDEELSDDQRNTAYYDYVRAFKLVKND